MERSPCTPDCPDRCPDPNCHDNCPHGYKEWVEQFQNSKQYARETSWQLSNRSFIAKKNRSKPLYGCRIRKW